MFPTGGAAFQHERFNGLVHVDAPNSDDLNFVHHKISETNITKFVEMNPEFASLAVATAATAATPTTPTTPTAPTTETASTNGETFINPVGIVETVESGASSGKVLRTGKHARYLGGGKRAPVYPHHGMGKRGGKKAAYKRMGGMMPGESPADVVDGITNNDIIRIARRSGVERISDDVYREVRRVTVEYLKRVISSSIIYAGMRLAETADDTTTHVEEDGTEVIRVMGRGLNEHPPNTDARSHKYGTVGTKHVVCSLNFHKIKLWGFDDVR